MMYDWFTYENEKQELDIIESGNPENNIGLETLRSIEKMELSSSLANKVQNVLYEEKKGLKMKCEEELKIIQTIDLQQCQTICEDHLICNGVNFSVEQENLCILMYCSDTRFALHFEDEISWSSHTYGGIVCFFLPTCFLFGTVAFALAHNLFFKIF
jgi:hypothetical protein